MCSIGQGAAHPRRNGPLCRGTQSVGAMGWNPRTHSSREGGFPGSQLIPLLLSVETGAELPSRWWTGEPGVSLWKEEAAVTHAVMDAVGTHVQLSVDTGGTMRTHSGRVSTHRLMFPHGSPSPSAGRARHPGYVQSQVLACNTVPWGERSGRPQKR